MFFTYTINLLKRNFHNSNKHNLTIKLTGGKKIGKTLSAIHPFFFFRLKILFALHVQSVGNAKIIKKKNSLILY